MFPKSSMFLCIFCLQLWLTSSAWTQETEGEDLDLSKEIMQVSDFEPEESDIPALNVALRNPFTPQVPALEKPVKVEEKGPADEDKVKTAEAPKDKSDVQEVSKPVIIGSPKLVITGLIWNSDRPQAIVNGDIVEVGDRLFGVPTDKSETIPEIKFVDITREGLAVSYMEKIVVLKPVEPKGP